MLLPLVTIAAVFLGIWSLALVVESWVRSAAQSRPMDTLSKTQISLGSLLMFLWTSANVMPPLPPLEFEADSEQEPDW